METQRVSARLFTAELAPSRTMRAKFLREVAEAHLPQGPGPRDPVTGDDIDELPAAAQRYLRFMAVVGHPRDWSFRARVTGRFRRSASEAWMPCEAWQYDSALEVARIFHMRLRLKGVVPVYVRDTYVHGHGRMLGRIFDRLSIVDEANEQIDTSELVTYLNDAIFFAPSMLLRPNVTWSEVDDSSFDVALTDQVCTVKARVFVDARGAVTDFSTTDRFTADPDNPKRTIRARWSTPVHGWTFGHHRPVPKSGQAVWHYPDGRQLVYADFTFDPNEIEIDIPPGSPSAN